MKTRLVTLLVSIVAAAGLVACGGEEEITHGENEGAYVTVDGLQYQVQISRQLNPQDAEDREYLFGLDGENAQLGPDQEWFAIFLRVRNADKDSARMSASEFKIEDTAGEEFEPIELPATSPHAYRAQRIPAKKHYPSLDVTSGSSTSQGALVLFKVTRRALDNRPLEFHIASPAGKHDAAVDLDI